MNIVRKQFLGGASARLIIKYLQQAIQAPSHGGLEDREHWIEMALTEASDLAFKLDKFGQELGYHTPATFD